MRRVAIALLLAAGCVHYPVNERLERYEPQRGHRWSPATDANTDSLTVCLAFSGGGTRAAALATGVLEKLRDTRVVWDGKEKRLLDEVDCVSGVSGGAFAAASFVLGGDSFFQDFPERFLNEDHQFHMKARVLRNSWWLWAAPRYKRSELVAEMWDEELFHGKTFADVEKKRPYLIVSATDMTNGQRFEFTQDQFDLIGSNLSSFPISRAVTASSAFPFFLSTITVRNHSRLEGPPSSFALPDAYTQALEDKDDGRLREWARHQVRYAASDGPRYLHLTDGGVADNTGVRALLAPFHKRDGFLRRGIESGSIRKLVVIVVNALNDPLRGLGDGEDAPNVATVLEKTARIAVNTLTFESVQWLREDPVVHNLVVKHQVDLKIIEVSFDHVEEVARREHLRGLPTTLSLPEEDVKAVRAVAGEILDASKDFQDLLAGLR